MNKRIIYALFYKEGSFHLSRNFRLQKVGNIDWLKNNFGFGQTCDFIDELIIILVKKSPTQEDYRSYFNDIEELRKTIFVPITLGGGIRDLKSAKNCFINGADKILINTAFFSDEKILADISNIYGSQAISLMIDYNIDITKKKRTVYTHCGSKKNIELNSKLLNKVSKSNCGDVILNSIEQDGTGSSLDLEILENIDSEFSKPLLIMGGAGKPEHITDALKLDKVNGVITGNLFNFLGTGLEISRNLAIKSGVKLANFEKIEL